MLWTRKIWGVLLSVVLFAMYPLSASAAPMTEAPVTSDQMVRISEWGHGRGYILPF